MDTNPNILSPGLWHSNRLWPKSLLIFISRLVKLAFRIARYQNGAIWLEKWDKQQIGPLYGECYRVHIRLIKYRRRDTLQKLILNIILPPACVSEASY